MSSQSSQRFCLRWNNHQSNLLSVFDQLLHDESFVDVTLAVEGRLLRAHKMVLSACSPYFQALFVGHPDKHPIVILKDVPYSDMRSLLDFMYRGEVSVDQDRLTAFLKVAESLRIKGLTEVNEEKCDLPSITNSLLSSSPMSHTPPPPHLHRIHPMNMHRRVAMPLLGSALTAPKRKRGRPRKLSGGSNVGSDGKEGDDRLDGVASSEEMCEQKMTESAGQRPMDVENGPLEKVNAVVNEHTNNNAKENHAAKRIKEEHEPTPGTSASTDPGQPFPPTITRPNPTEPFAIEGHYDEERPIITFELCSDNSSQPDNEDSTGIHFLTHDPDDNCLLITKSEEIDPEDILLDTIGTRGRHELLEYLIQDDGSVVCKWCGEVLPSRTHWYRHKYKFHVASSNANGPAPLFKCDRCNVFFKSRKGYIGHLATRHGDVEKDERVLDVELKVEEGRGKRKSLEGLPKGVDYEVQREKEEKLVADIIDRVRRECEATGATVTRRGYSRRSTVMNSS